MNPIAAGRYYIHMVTRKVYLVTRCEGCELKQDTGEWVPSVRYEPATWDEAAGLKPEYHTTQLRFNERFTETEAPKP